MKLFRRNKEPYWNYRIKEKIYEMSKEAKEDYIASMKNVFGDTYKPNLDPDIFYEVVEVYYDANNKITAWTEDTITPWRKLRKRIFRRIKEI